MSRVVALADRGGARRPIDKKCLGLEPWFRTPGIACPLTDRCGSPATPPSHSPSLIAGDKRRDASRVEDLPLAQVLAEQPPRRRALAPRAPARWCRCQLGHWRRRWGPWGCRGWHRGGLVSASWASWVSNTRMSASIPIMRSMAGSRRSMFPVNDAMAPSSAVIRSSMAANGSKMASGPTGVIPNGSGGAIMAMVGMSVRAAGP